MNRKLTACCGLFSILIFLFCDNDQNVIFIQGKNQIDVRFGEKLVTSYRFSPDQAKPILYPVHSPSGIMVNRGFPINGIAGESQDHPHHAGIWFACDDVNDNKFWNTIVPPPQIKHVTTTKIKGGRSRGTLAVVLSWIAINGQTLLKEDRTMIFNFTNLIYTIDFTITLTAIDTTVMIHDTKEGLFAIRVADWLSEKKGTGRYHSSNGAETETEVWGTRANWMRLEGEKDGKKIGIVIMEHPRSANHPTFWMARAYGLFAANPIGQQVYLRHHQVEDARPLNLTLKRGDHTLFKFRMLIYETDMTHERIEQIYRDYADNSQF